MNSKTEYIKVFDFKETEQLDQSNVIPEIGEDFEKQFDLEELPKLSEKEDEELPDFSDEMEDFLRFSKEAQRPEPQQRQEKPQAQEDRKENKRQEQQPKFDILEQLAQHAAQKDQKESKSFGFSNEEIQMIRGNQGKEAQLMELRQTAEESKKLSINDFNIYFRTNKVDSPVQSIKR